MLPSAAGMSAILAWTVPATKTSMRMLTTGLNMVSYMGAFFQEVLV